MDGLNRSFLLLVRIRVLSGNFRDNMHPSFEACLSLIAIALVRKDEDVIMVLVCLKTRQVLGSLALDRMVNEGGLGNTMVAPEEGTVIDVTVIEEFGSNSVATLFATIDIDGSTQIKQWRSKDGEVLAPCNVY